ncbi:SMP-30/gluconolaconase/LRE domain-containing protein [Cupriavidus gilardii CR3]|uniref:SMP-30/gluconolactonase/LRE family protein n=1 Tax=Cupriavidus gilardii TaxID=82541 RepID=A0A849BEX1_9BURK|nr:SMP-30/gluconolactonase/LRE family protein [Cupriavidus gilardii]ALD93383.1 SMP-30/gluconolaconase/LRE domain-containing protein [Cupriavidus gilardii CR3]KAB0599229.1 SMP-30/gluconolactonase/LRE family protein [Cupriavidus gilardii]MCT9013323.1 SMP-30/gluconolactonase/LRE family protein [Cupriavidus gilardii]MCT9052877.1 SMP-30/gluconolactonase/LRE family protein [Cupriavidus gilardii]NNH12363.1 SMP-30/gluconolactonase/LRE family protein [Cupriavidus gilardii]
MLLLTQPALRDAEVFTSLPDALRCRGVVSDWARANRGGAAIDAFLEGPVWANGCLWVTDIPFGRIFRISPRGDWELVAQYDGEPNGMKWLGGDAFLITDYRNGLMLLDARSGTVRPWLERRNSERFRGVNDLTFDSRGNLYFTDQGQTGMHDPTGRVYRLAPDGKLDVLISNAPSPNGLVLSADETVLFVAMTRGNCVWRVPLQADGSVSKVGQFFASYGPSGPDGLVMRADGHLLVANPGLGYLWVLNPRAEPVEVIRSPAGTSLTNACFGGDDGSTLFMTESTSSSILRIEMPQGGAPVHGAGSGRYGR